MKTKKILFQAAFIIPGIVFAYYAFSLLTMFRSSPNIYSFSKEESIDAGAFIADYEIMHDTVWVVKGEKCAMPLPQSSFIEKKRRYLQAHGLFQYWKTTEDDAFTFTLTYPADSVSHYQRLNNHRSEDKLTDVAAKAYENDMPDTVHMFLRRNDGRQYENLVLKKVLPGSKTMNRELIRHIVHVDSICLPPL